MQRRTRNQLPLWPAGCLWIIVLAGIVCSGGCDEEAAEPYAREPDESNSISSVDENYPQDVGVAERENVPEDANWPPPRFSERREDREGMVDRIHRAYDFTDTQVLDAMRNVPRHEFVPEHLSRSAYADRPLPIGHDQTISQPYIVALMTSLLELNPDKKVLEVGTGSGYQAAVLAELTPHVYTIEIVPPLGRRAIRTFDVLGYETIRARIGDGYRGWPEAQPFDGIIVTCAPHSIPEPLVGQLKVGGRMVIPVGAYVQELVLVTKNEDGSLDRRSVLPVRFVPMTGEAQRR